MRNLPRGLVLVTATLLLALGQGLPGAAFAVSDAEIRKAEGAFHSVPRDDANRAELARLFYLKGSDLSGAGNAAGAAEEFKKALSLLEDRQSKIPEQYPVYEEARYGLGFAYLAMGQPQHAVVVLDQLAAGSPRFTRARYLLGIALLRAGTEAGMHRGAEVLAQLAKEAPPPDGTAALHALTRYSFDLATGMAATGDAPGAAAVMQDVGDRFGSAIGASAAESQAFLYTMGAFQVSAGDASAAAADFESLKSQNAGFRPKHGLTVQRALSNAHYQAGLDQLRQGGEAALQRAIAHFDQADANGTGKEVDTHHGKALAYKRLKQPDKMALELGIILTLDPEYFKKINTGS